MSISCVLYFIGSGATFHHFIPQLLSLIESSENDQLTGHFQSFFFFFFLISPETVKLVKGIPTICIKSLNILSFP